MALRDFQAKRRQGEIPNVLLMYGQEQGLIQQAMEEVRRVSLLGEEADGPLDVESFLAKEADGERLHSACRSLPFFLSHRLVLVKQVDEAPAAIRDVLLAYLKRPARSTRLILTAENLEAANPLRKACEADAAAWCVAFYTLEGEGFRQWVVQQLKEDGYTIAPDALMLLTERLTGNTLAAVGELNKLKLFMGQERLVKVADLLAVVGETSAISGFAMADATMAGRTAEALHILERLLESGEEPLLLLGLLTRRIRLIIQGKVMLNRGDPLKSVAGKLRIFWKEEQSFHGQCRQWQEEALADALLLCLEADINLKGEGVTPQITMERLVMGLGDKAGALRRV